MLIRPKNRDTSILEKRFQSGLIAVVAIGLLGLATTVFVHQMQNISSNLPAGIRALYGSGGTLIIAGGGILPEVIPSRFCELAGGARARLVVIPAYDATPNEERGLIREWKQRRVASVDVALTRSRDDEASSCLVSKIKNATGVWITGGEQTTPAIYYPGTEVESELWNLLERGGVIGGTSAGAAIMSRVMIEEGGRGKEVKTRQGLDLMRGAVIDQHFMQRNRLSRWRGVLDQHPSVIGIGIDEGTALMVKVDTGRLSVIGNSYVMLWAPSGTPSPHRAEILKAGDTYDLDELDWDNAQLDYRMQADEGSS